MKRTHYKPVGTDGTLRHEYGPSIDKRTFDRHLSPKPKDAIEADVAAAFVSLMQGRGAKSLKLLQLSENDLDFSCETDGCRAKIEFTELVLANPPYQEDGQSAIISYKPWGEKFFELVQKKSKKHYKESVSVDLLVYTTHFAYHGNEFCVALAAERMRCFEGGANFRNIYYLEYARKASRLHTLKPYRDTLPSKLRREYEGLWYANMNFANGTPIPGGTAFRID